MPVFLASQRTLSVLPQAQPVEEEEIDRTAFGRGFVREPFQRERSFGVVEEALADTAFGKFFGFDAEEARAKQEAAEAELRRLELEDPSIRFEDITGLGTAASVSGEALGGEARDMAIQAGATATGAGIGGLFFGAGAAPGAAIGRTAGVAYTTAQAAPQMLAEAIEAQKEEGNEVNLTKALGATAINLLSEFVTDYFVIGKLIPKEAKSKVGSAVRSAIEAGTAEGATEVFQQAVIRGQAGQDLTSPEAIAEYAESLYSGMTVGGTIGGVGGFLSTPDRSAEKELDDDLKELREYGLAGFKFAEETEKDIEAQRKAALGAVGIDLDAPLQIGTDGAPLALPAPDAAEIAPKPVIADTEFENLSFNKAEYERVLQQVKADITRRKPQPEQAEVDVPSSEPLSKPVSNPINIPAIHQRVKADIPGITVSQVRDIMKELQARGFVAENPASKKNKFIPMGSLAPEVKTPDVSYRRQIDSAADFIKADQTRLERLQYDLRSAEAYGRDLEGNRVTPNQVNATIARVEQRIAQEPDSASSWQTRAFKSLGP
jgi:gas vesicle protein